MNKKIILLIILMALFILPVNGYYYTLNFYALSNNPLDKQVQYIGNLPRAPVLTKNTSMIFFPTSGTIEIIELMDYSSTIEGSDECYKYYISINGTTDYLIENLTINNFERRFINSSYSIPVNAGDFFEIKRYNPVWSINPMGNTVSGYVIFNSSVRGYVIPIMALSSSPIDGVRNYIGTIPAAPITTAGQRKMYVPASGFIERIDIYDNSSAVTSGTNEAVYYSFEVNGNQLDEYKTHLFGKLETANGGRLFNITYSPSIPLSGFTVSKKDYIEVYRANPIWSTNPLLNVIGGNIFINTTNFYDTDTGEGYPLYFFALTSSNTNLNTRYFSNILLAPVLDEPALRPMYNHKKGNITSAHLYSISGTAGQASIYVAPIVGELLGRYGQTTSNISNIERLTFIDAKALHENMPLVYVSSRLSWQLYTTFYAATKPANTIYSGWMWLEYSPATKIYLWNRTG